MRGRRRSAPTAQRWRLRRQRRLHSDMGTARTAHVSVSTTCGGQRVGGRPVVRTRASSSASLLPTNLAHADDCDGSLADIRISGRHHGRIRIGVSRQTSDGRGRGPSRRGPLLAFTAEAAAGRRIPTTVSGRGRLRPGRHTRTTESSASHTTAGDGRLVPGHERRRRGCCSARAAAGPQAGCSSGDRRLPAPPPGRPLSQLALTVERPAPLP